MADKRIKGITIEIGGETTGLQRALSDVNKRSQDLTSELKQVERGLKFNPDSVELLAQKQQLLTEQVENTTERLNRLKTAQSQVEQQFKSGQIGAEQYRAFQREVVQTESKLDHFKKQLASVDDGNGLVNVKRDAEEAKKAIGGLGSELAGLAGALAATGGIAGAISQALDTSTLDTKIDISFNVPDESKESIKLAVREIEAYGVDGEAALEGVRRQWALNKDASDEVNASIIKGAGVIATAYSGVDFTELIQETNEVAFAIGVSNQEALALVNSLLKAGFPPEQLDTIAEYGQQMKDVGFSAKEIQAIFESGINTKTWNIDNLNDGVKEARLQMASFGQEVPKSMADILEYTDLSINQMQQWGKAVAEGGEKGSKAMSEMVTWLEGIEDKSLKNAVATEIFKTKWEDQGQNMIAVFKGLDSAVDKTKQNQDALNDSTAKLDASPAVKLQQAMKDLKTALEPVLSVIASVISKIAEWVQNNPTLAASIVAVATAVGVIVGACIALAPILSVITTAAGAMGIGIAALAGPIGIAVAAIAGVIAIGVALYKNWDEVKAHLSKTWEEIKKISETVWNSITEFFKTWGKLMVEVITGPVGLIAEFIYNNWNQIKEFVSTTVELIKNTVSDKFQQLKNAVMDKMTQAKETIMSIWKQAESFLKSINLVDIGINIIQGLIDGIREKVSELWSVVGEIADGIKNFFARALGINSPSRVFMGFGENIGEGLAIGLDKSIGKVQLATKEMTMSVIPDTSSVSNNYGGNNLYITVQGNDASDQVDSLLRELHKRGIRI